ncbi:MAG TPA: SHOCT domain-containing protein [Pseudonocardia sp.]|nr:SHOCT domain-containing protein [Pseudonocardia sp.]
MRGRLGRGRGGPGLLGTVARTAVIAGTASAVSGRVHAGQQAAAQQQQQAAAAQEQLRQMQLQAQIDDQVNARMAGAQAAPASAPASARPSVDELHAQLTKLGELRQAGLLSDAEFAEQKARLLA